jgi:uncharacterized protein YjbI with pentapeptide repeats
MVWVRLRNHLQRKQTKLRQDLAFELYQRRVRFGRQGDQHTDWVTAGKLLDNPFRQILFALNGPLIWLEKTCFEPTDQLLERAAFFDVIDRLSPALEALGVLLIPLVLYVATQSFEERRDEQEVQRLQQEAIEDYIAQVTEVLLNAEGDLRSEENQRIRDVLTATTLAQLRDPNLDGDRKGQVIEFLTRTDLVQAERRLKDLMTQSTPRPVVSLSRADLEGADLERADLRGVDLMGANLRGANLRRANLRGAYLAATDLAEADLRGAELSGAYLEAAYIAEADLRGAELSGAYLDRIYLCKTLIPQGFPLDPDQDCGKAWLPFVIF